MQPEANRRSTLPGVKIVLGINLALWLLLLATGLLLLFFYRPTAAAVYADMDTSRSAVTFGLVMRYLHRWCSTLAVLAALPIPIVYLIDERKRAALVSIVTVLVVAVSWFSGQFLPWDQMALWAVTTGTDMMGYTPVFGDDVRFVLVGGVEIDSNTFLRWFIVHVAVVPILLAGVAYTADRFARRSA